MPYYLQFDMPTRLTSGQRRIVHRVAHDCGLHTQSEGSGADRFVRITKGKDALCHAETISAAHMHNHCLSVCFASGSLCNVSLRGLIADVHKFSELRGVRACLEQSEVVVTGCSSQRHVAECRAELEHMLCFYGVAVDRN